MSSLLTGHFSGWGEDGIKLLSDSGGGYGGVGIKIGFLKIIIRAPF